MLAPTPAAEVDPAEVYADDRRRPRPDRPWVLTNMIVTADGATAVAGRSGELGGPADRRVFGVLRDLADVVLVGAGTVRAESYGPPKAPGRRVAVVSASGRLDWSAPLFTSGAGIAVLTEEAPDPPGTVPTIRAGRRRVDVGVALTALRALGARVVLAEGGPSLNGDLLAAGCIDEWCLTLSPMLLAGTSARPCVGSVEHRHDLLLVHVLEEDGLLFLRYLAAVAAEGSTSRSS